MSRTNYQGYKLIRLMSGGNKLESTWPWNFFCLFIKYLRVVKISTVKVNTTCSNSRGGNKIAANIVWKENGCGIEMKAPRQVNIKM